MLRTNTKTFPEYTIIVLVMLLSVYVFIRGFTYNYFNKIHDHCQWDSPTTHSSTSTSKQIVQMEFMKMGIHR